MIPIGPLMHEHRLIERMVALVSWKARAMVRGAAVDLGFLDEAVLFFRQYAGRCHHGKEEAIIFAELGHMTLPPELTAVMAELVREHRQTQELVVRLETARARHDDHPGEAESEISAALAGLADFYPRHIAKENKLFYRPVMELFDRPTRNALLERFDRFDHTQAHGFFSERLERWEEAR